MSHKMHQHQIKIPVRHCKFCLQQGYVVEEGKHKSFPQSEICKLMIINIKYVRSGIIYKTLSDQHRNVKDRLGKINLVVPSSFIFFIYRTSVRAHNFHCLDRWVHLNSYWYIHNIK